MSKLFWAHDKKVLFELYELSKSLASFGHIIMACLKSWLATSPLDMSLMTHFWAPHYASIWGVGGCGGDIDRE